MREYSLAESKDIFFLAALLTAQLSYSGQGFRQRDLKFFLELYLNWIKTPFQSDPLEIQNVQVKRFLKDLDQEGYLIERKEGSHPVYRLNRAGLLEAIRRFVEKDHFDSADEILFQIYFIKSYKQRIVSLFKGEGRKFPDSIKIEIQSLLDLPAIVNDHITRVDTYLKKLHSRIIDNLHSAQLVEKLQNKGAEIDQIIAAVEDQHPYQLNSLKPLGKLLSEFPDYIQIEELRSSGIDRAEMIWKKQFQVYMLLKKELLKLV